MRKYDVDVGDIVRFYIDPTDNRKITVEFINVDIKKLTYIESRNQVVLTFTVIVRHKNEVTNRYKTEMKV